MKLIDFSDEDFIKEKFLKQTFTCFQSLNLKVFAIHVLILNEFMKTK